MLKHELVHVITLQQTNFNIPHWYTEALAIWSEGGSRPQPWSELLVTRLAEKRLFNLDTINFGFTRPTSSDDWPLAYCQAELYLEYMLDGRNEQTLRDWLAAYRDGLTTGESIRRGFGMSLERFEEGYTDYLKKIAAAMAGIEPKSQEAFPDLLQALREAPADANVGAKVAEGYLRRGAYPEALAAKDYQAAGDWANQALKIDVSNAGVHCAFAESLLRRHNYRQAIEEFEAAVELAPHELQPRFALADACLQDGDARKARQVLVDLLRIAPDFPGAEPMLESVLEDLEKLEREP